MATACRCPPAALPSHIPPTHTTTTTTLHLQHFTHNYIEVNDLRLRVGWSWYLAGLAGLATTALLLLGLRLSWRAERQHHQQGQAASKDAPVRALNRGRQLSGPPVALQGERRQPRRQPPSETTQRAYHYS